MFFLSPTLQAGWFDGNCPDAIESAKPEWVKQGFNAEQLGFRIGFGEARYHKKASYQDLLDEGLAREVVNRVQKTRKEIKLNVSDHIRVVYTGSDELCKAIETHLNYIQRETLSNEFTRGEVINGGFKFTIDDFDIRFENRQFASQFNLGPVSFDVRAGLEVDISNLVYIRGGYSDVKQFTVGAGVKLPKLNKVETSKVK